MKQRGIIAGKNTAAVQKVSLTSALGRRVFKDASNQKLRRYILKEAYRMVDKVVSENPDFEPTPEQIEKIKETFIDSIMSGLKTQRLRKDGTSVLIKTNATDEGARGSSSVRELALRAFEELATLFKQHKHRRIPRRAYMDTLKNKLVQDIESLKKSGKKLDRHKIKKWKQMISTLRPSSIGFFSFDFRCGLRIYRYSLGSTGRGGKDEELTSVSIFEPGLRKKLPNVGWLPRLRTGREESISKLDPIIRMFAKRLNAELTSRLHH